MADDYDPAMQGDAWGGDGEGYSGADIQQTANTQHSSRQDDAFSVEPPHDSGDDQSNDGASDAGDYDPETVTSSLLAGPESAASLPQSNPSPQPTSKKPKSAGGFLVGESESEDEEPVSSSNGPLSHGPTLQAEISAVSSRQPSIIVRDADSEFRNGQDVSHTKDDVHGGEHRSNPQIAVTATDLKPKPAHDTIATWEAQVREDPRGALDAWMGLINEYRARNRMEDARNIYERFLSVFPQAADIWISYLEMELNMNNFVEAERIFGMCLMGTPNVNLWTKYLDYIRRRNDLSDSTGHARQVVAQAYEFVIDNIGLDKDSGKIWADYIQFIKFGPGQVGGSSWQDQQKMDQLRKAYQRAICVPIQNVNTLWKEYDQFEMGLNKTTGRKFLAEKSPAYMSAKSANTALENITRGLDRTTLPRLPPAPGFDGDQDYMEQVEIWKRWISWEKSDPLDLKSDEPELLRKRILYVYKQATMALRFWPEIWVDAAEWSFENELTKDGTDVGMDFLRQGIAANPESVLLALKHADRIEATYAIEENDEAKIARGRAVREPYNKVLDTLYDMIKTLKDREKTEIAKIEESTTRPAPSGSVGSRVDNEDDEDDTANQSQRDKAKQDQIRAIQQGFTAQVQLLSRTISFVWIALARAMRRIQGKGKPGTSLGGMRQVFTDARQRGRLTSDVYVAIAQLEWTVYKEPAGAKIFERGSKLFPEDENFTIEYLKFLHSRDDFTNARVVFETCVNRLTQKPELVHKAKPLYAYFHKYESQFGELSQISKLEKRMAELFPEDPKLAHFSSRFSTDKFDPIAARIIVSPATQLRPKRSVISSIEQPTTSIQGSPRPQAFRAINSPRIQHVHATNSPKRPFQVDEHDDMNPPRKMQRSDLQEFQRGASPLKGAAGRRLDQQRRHGASSSYNTTAPVIPRDVTFLLTLIPPADTYNAQRFSAPGMVKLLQDTVIPDYSTWKARDQNSQRRNIQPSASHTPKISGDYSSQYGIPGRESPNPQRRQASPFPTDAQGRGSRLAPASAVYPPSNAQTMAGGPYEQHTPAPYPHAAPAQPSSSYGHNAAPTQGSYDGGSWSAYGNPIPAHGYAATQPNLPQNPTPQPQLPRGQYQYQ
ncbi:hypothetical protein VTK73DRAFT_6838 [Phialemonium thermophilum]|uniref:mRNA 3'-end-processing protein RNA14 n=1 Tax=Phialemonium thermophilum TaxID=223376 RepID=A0ABR3Y7A1_9PEZI